MKNFTNKLRKNLTKGLVDNMRATGIVRRIDDLGRVVIPKEIRRTMGIREGDPLEIYTEGNMVCFKRYRFIDDEQWSKAEMIASVGFDKFGLYDSDGTLMKGDRIRHECHIYTECPIIVNDREEGYLVVPDAEGKEELIGKIVLAIQKALE